MLIESQTHIKPSLRQAQANLTRRRICEAAATLLEAEGNPEAITFKAVAARAEMTEITVYRHFPNRDALLRGVWEHLNAQMGPDIGMPKSIAELRDQHEPMFQGFDRIAPQIIAAVATPQGREIRASLNGERQEAFLALVAQVAPELDPIQKRQRAALIQLLHSAYAWASLREQWGFSGAEAAQATGWLIDLIVQNMKEPMR